MGKAGKGDRTKVQRKEAERTNFPTSRCRCNVAVVTKKEETHDIRKQKKEKRKSGKESQKRVTSLS